MYWHVTKYFRYLDTEKRINNSPTNKCPQQLWDFFFWFSLIWQLGQWSINLTEVNCTFTTVLAERRPYSTQTYLEKRPFLYSFTYLFVLINNPGETIQCAALFSYGFHVAVFSQKCWASIFISKTGIGKGSQRKWYIKVKPTKTPGQRQQSHQKVKQETGQRGELQVPKDKA